MDPADTLERFISSPRFETYVEECDGDRSRAVELYHWTGEVGGSLLVDFRHFEVILRNHLHETLSQHTAEHHTIVGEWYEDSSWVNHRWWNAAAQGVLDDAIERAGGTGAPADGVVSELSFGFWRYLLAERYEQSFWQPALDAAFDVPGKTWKERRFKIEQEVLVLNNLRNRLAHHQPIFKPHMRRGSGNVEIEVPLGRQHNGMLHVLSWIDQSLPTLVMEKSTVKQLLSQRP